MAGVAVVTDSTSSLTSTAADRAGIAVISLQVVIDGHSRPESEVDPRLVAAALREGKRVTTSRPSPQAFSVVYDSLAAAGHQEVVSVHLSAKISGTCEAAELAARGAPIPVTVVDSGSLGMVTGFAALSGAECAARGRPRRRCRRDHSSASGGLDGVLLRQQPRLPPPRRANQSSVQR